jgi:hypothetical protein
MSYKELLPNLKDLTLRNVVQTDAGWVVEAEGSGAVAACSLCGVDSCSRHSYYSTICWIVVLGPAICWTLL